LRDVTPRFDPAAITFSPFKAAKSWQKQRVSSLVVGDKHHDSQWHVERERVRVGANLTFAVKA